MVSGRADGARHEVTIDASRFEPRALTIHVGDSVAWVNKDIITHTATSDAGQFDSDEIAPGKSWAFTATRKGDFDYVCSLHRSMKGSLRVE
jgi:plastocyanin